MSLESSTQVSASRPWTASILWCPAQALNHLLVTALWRPKTTPGHKCSSHLQFRTAKNTKSHRAGLGASSTVAGAPQAVCTSTQVPNKSFSIQPVEVKVLHNRSLPRSSHWCCGKGVVIDPLCPQSRI